MTSHFGLLIRKCLQKFFFRVTNSTLYNIKLNFELLTRKLNFYFFTFELKNKKLHFDLLTRSQKIKKHHFELLILRLNLFCSTLELLTQSQKKKSYTSSY